MKRCPQCNLSYSDQTLEFCLEDGARLFSVNITQTATPTITIPDKSNIFTENTANLPFPNQPGTLHFQDAKSIQPIVESNSIKEKSTIQNYKILEISSITISLAHNWWQWLYLNNLYYSSFSSYVLSANFLMWLLLLAAGAIVGWYALKQAQNKALPIVSLIILAINLILFLVPKH